MRYSSILVWNPFFELSLPRLIDVMIWCTRITAKSCQTLLFVRPKPTTRPSITEYKDNKLMAINSCLEMLKNEWPLFTVYDIRTVRQVLFFQFCYIWLYPWWTGKILRASLCILTKNPGSWIMWSISNWHNSYISVFFFKDDSY